MAAQPLSLVMRSDCALIDAALPSQRMLEVVVRASDVPLADGRAPLNLALILDRSGSMSGSKLTRAIQAAQHVIDGLTEHDRVALVAYDDQVITLSRSETVTPWGKENLRTALRSLHPGGSTNLCGGWMQGALEVAEHLLDGGVNRALLLTDGLANVGVSDPEALALHARELRMRGVSTSTFGVGLDFNEHLLSAMAEQGGGHFYYIERPEQI